jgi:hypothetical protein
MRYWTRHTVCRPSSLPMCTAYGICQCDRYAMHVLVNVRLSTCLHGYRQSNGIVCDTKNHCIHEGFMCQRTLH